MSLELISELEKVIDDKTIALIIENISINGYKNVYFFEDYNSYGFVQEGDTYLQNTPPLFDLFINSFQISLSVYGDLNDLEKIRKTVTECFKKHSVYIQLTEEGEDV